MRIEAVVKDLSQMSIEELQEVIRRVRRNKYTVRPAKQAHARKAAKKEGAKTISQIEKMLDKMSPEEIMQVLKGG